MIDSEILITGAKGMLGSALKQQYPGAKHTDKDEMDITDRQAVEQFDWTGIKIIVNAAAYTNVDGAETPEGRVAAWNVNATAVSNLARVAVEQDICLVHLSTDYVFDGKQTTHTEDEPFSPLSEYGKSKAEGDKAVMNVPKYYLIRTSWVIGEGKNFVRTMLELGKKGVNPTVVADQVGRLTFTTELVRAIDHLLMNNSPFGTYNVSNEGYPTSWAEITREIFTDAGLNTTVTSTTTAEYYAGKTGIAPRPLQSTLDLSKIKATGFEPHNWQDDLRDYVKQELEK